MNKRAIINTKDYKKVLEEVRVSIEKFGAELSQPIKQKLACTYISDFLSYVEFTNPFKTNFDTTWNDLKIAEIKINNDASLKFKLNDFNDIEISWMLGGITEPYRVINNFVFKDNDWFCLYEKHNKKEPLIVGLVNILASFVKTFNTGEPFCMQTIQ